MTTESLSASYFEELYAKNPDPWNFTDSAYEREKYEDTVASLKRPLYAAGLEVGCSIGVLTRMLALRCESLTAIDLSEAALAEARRRCGDLANVKLERSELPERAPSGIFDLIVLSEVLYYLDAADLERAKDALLHASAPGAHFMLVHYTPRVPEYPQTGDAVHEAFLADARFVPLHGHRADRYRLDLLAARAA